MNKDLRLTSQLIILDAQRDELIDHIVCQVRKPLANLGVEHLFLLIHRILIVTD